MQLVLGNNLILWRFDLGIVTSCSLGLFGPTIKDRVSWILWMMSFSSQANGRRHCFPSVWALGTIPRNPLGSGSFPYLRWFPHGDVLIVCYWVFWGNCLFSVQLSPFSSTQRLLWAPFRFPFPLLQLGVLLRAVSWSLHVFPKSQGHCPYGLKSSKRFHMFCLILVIQVAG